jgi:tetratricopeptide (TPR) repeat protein
LTRLLAVLLLVFAGAAPDAQELYRAGRYAEALASYEATIASSPEPSGAALYNAGNCAFRLADYPNAALYYRRAALRIPDDPRVRFNLQLTQRKLGIPPEADSLLGSLTQAARQVAPVKILAAAAALEIAGLVLVVTLRRRKGWVLTGAVLLAGAAAGGALYVQRAYGAAERQGMVMVPEASV